MLYKDQLVVVKRRTPFIGTVQVVFVDTAHDPILYKCQNAQGKEFIFYENELEYPFKEIGEFDTK